jgi:hypothetical protein
MLEALLSFVSAESRRDIDSVSVGIRDALVRNCG